MYIYKITNKLNGKIYIGQSIRSVEKSGSYYGSGIYIVAAIKKYGKCNFEKAILEHCSSVEELNTREIYWIAELNSTIKNIGYNINAGGEGLTIYHNKSEEESALIFSMLSDANKTAWDKILQTYSKDELDQLYQKKREVALNYWLSLTVQEREEHASKISKSLQNSEYDFAAFTTNLWANRTCDERTAIGDKISLALKSRWNTLTDVEKHQYSNKLKDGWSKLTDAEKQQHSDRQKIIKTEYWNNITDDKLDAFRDKISETSKQMWQDFDSDKYDTIMDKKSTTMKNKYKNDPDFVNKKNAAVRLALGKSIKITEIDTKKIILMPTVTEAINFLDISKFLIYKILKNEVIVNEKVLLIISKYKIEYGRQEEKDNN